MTTLRVGIAAHEDFKARTTAIARGELKVGADEPKVWFTSLESLAKVLSDSNRELLALIAQMRPTSMQELAERSGRARSNLSRTLRTMEKYGLVAIEPGAGRKRIPTVLYTDIELSLPLREPGGAERKAKRTAAKWRASASR